MYREYLKPQNIFAFICLVFGLFFVFFNPPFQTSDENSHFWKIYSISEGHFNLKRLTTNFIDGAFFTRVYTGTGDYMPAGIYLAGYKNLRLRSNPEQKTSFEETKIILNYKLQKDKMVFNGYNVPVYTIFSYFPQVIVMKICNFFNINPGVSLYLMRCVSLFVYCFLVYVAIKVTPVKKWLFFMLALMPMCIYQAASVNIDGLLFACAFLTAAYVLYLGYDDKIKTIDKKQKAVLFLLMSFIVFSKAPYFPLLFIYFFIPKSKFKNTTEYITTFLYLILINLFIVVCFKAYVAYVCTLTDTVFKTNLAYDFLIHKPLIFVKITMFTTLMNFGSYVNGFVGTFGWNDTPLPSYCVFIYILMLIMQSVFSCKEDKKTYITRPFLCTFAFIIIYFLIFAALFLAFQVDSNGTIGHFGGRYLIPAAPVLFFAFLNNKFYLKHMCCNILNIVSILIVNFVLFVSLIRILYRFYV